MKFKINKFFATQEGSVSSGEAQSALEKQIKELNEAIENRTKEMEQISEKDPTDIRLVGIKKHIKRLKEKLEEIEKNK